jgi:predicted lipid-binding transport protein (Tim44 family)
VAALAGLVAGALIGSSLAGGAGHGLRGRDWGFLLDLVLLGGSIVLSVVILRRRHAALARATPAASHPEASSVPATLADPPSGDPGFDRGIQDIRQLDPGFDPARFAGYTGMMFRDAQNAWTIRDIRSLRDRVTPQMFGELQTEHDRLRSTRRSNHVERIEIQTEITEAWQENRQDYVTACIGGSIVDYTVDDASDAVVAGSRTIPRAVEELWTFTRPAGLNFWMLSAIQTGQALEILEEEGHSALA